MDCVHCGKKAIGRGLCRAHYQQAWKDGNLSEYTTKQEQFTPKDRLLAKYRVTESGCWEWTAHRRADKMDYGLLWVDGKMHRAHRLSYEVHKGEIPPGIDVLHKCDNPPCINPDHLFLGTRGENCTDAASKNRFPLNDKHWNTKLSVEQVLEIRKSTGSQIKVALQYGVVPSTIWRIRNGARRQKA